MAQFDRLKDGSAIWTADLDYMWVSLPRKFFRKFFNLKIYDEHGRKKLLGEMNPEELKRTIEISRNDGNKLVSNLKKLT